MPDTPVAKKPEPEGPPPGSKDNLVPTPGTGKRWSRKAILRPVVLAAIGLALLLISFFLYPRTTQLPSPEFSRLAVAASGIRVAFIEYGVAQVSPDMAEIKISVSLPTGTPGPPVAARAAFLAVEPPFGTRFRDCHPAACTVESNKITTASIWKERLTFRPVDSTGTATADLFVKARSFGVTSDGVNVSTAIPEALYQGLGKPTLLTLYQLQSANSYDWSAAPAAAVSSTTVQWQQDVASGDTPGRTAVGINHSAQTGDDIKIFIAGALVGGAGGAIIAAVQEAMHLGD